MSFRKEKKFRLTLSDSLILESQLISDGMKKIYPARKIYSQYLDTIDLKMFNESEEGLIPRKKIRARWYKNKNEVSLETKISSLEGRYKITKKIDLELLSNIYSKGHFDKDYGFLYPSLVVTYARKYYLWKNMRITFDSDIEYCNSRYDSGSLMKDFENVLEIKTLINIPDDYIEKNFGHQTSRFSKYCRGILISEKQLF